MNKRLLKRKLTSLIDGEPLGEELTILYKNPVTGVTEVLYQSPAAKGLEVQVDDPKTGQTFLKLRDHEHKEDTQKQA